MIKDQKIADQLQINFTKGILLSGPIGCSDEDFFESKRLLYK